MSRYEHLISTRIRCVGRRPGLSQVDLEAPRRSQPSDLAKPKYGSFPSRRAILVYKRRLTPRTDTGVLACMEPRPPPRSGRWPPVTGAAMGTYGTRRMFFFWGRLRGWARTKLPLSIGNPWTGKWRPSCLRGGRLGNITCNFSLGTGLICTCTFTTARYVAPLGPLGSWPA